MKMSLDALVKALEENPDLEPCTETLLPFVDGPEFFEGFLGANVLTALGRFKTAFYKREGNLLRLISQQKGFFRECVQSIYPTLDSVKYVESKIASALGVERVRPIVARACVEHGLLSPELPDNYPLKSQSLYFKKRVVGEKQALRNLKKAVQAKYATLDDVDANSTLAKFFGVESSIKNVVKACVEHGLLSSELPDDHPIGLGSGSHRSKYIDREIVGEEQSMRNVGKFVQATYGNLDAVEMRPVLAAVLSVDRLKILIARACLEHGFLSAEMPDNYPVHGGKGKKATFYFNKEVVGEENALRNIRKYVQATYETLGNLKMDDILAGALGVKNKISCIARACVEHGFLSAEMPDNYPIKKSNKSSHPCWYIDVEVVGEKQAMSNIKKYVQATYSCLDDVQANGILGRVLGLKRIRSVSELRKKIAELGWLETERFRCYAESNLPEQFRQTKKERLRTKKSKKPRKCLRNIGAYAQERLPNNTTFIKGESFEQLFGLFLAYTSPNKLIIPQYCLDVGENYFRTRADFRVGNAIYEIKWGNAKEMIESDYTKHEKLMRRKQNKRFQYRLIRLEEKAVSLGIPHEMFGSLLEQQIDDSEVKKKFCTIVDLLRSSARRREDTAEIGILVHLRDFLYNKIDEANRKTGTERRQLIRKALDEIVALVGDKDALDQYLIKHTKRALSPLEAHFEYRGKLYRAFIDLRKLKEEQPERYETVYYFGDVEFASELDRNVAVLLECSSQVRRVERTLDKPKQFHVHPVFRISPRRAISTNDHPKATRVRSLKEVKDMLCISNGMYDFALEYIKESGLRC